MAFKPAFAAAATTRPNIIVILADDLGYSDVGFNGCRDIPTPGIDRIAREGVRFTNGYVSHPYCSPTRAGLMTGRYQQRFGHENNLAYLPDDETVGLPLDQTTIADVLKSAGYVTGMVGKWHLGAHPKLHPTRRGFDEYFGFLGGGHDYYTSGRPLAEYEAELVRDGVPLWLGRPNPAVLAEWQTPVFRDNKPTFLPEYMTTAFGRAAEAFVERHRAAPFFLYLAFNAPHTPMQAPDEYLARFRAIPDEGRRMYAAMISAMDDAVARLLSALDRLKLADNTLVVFLSDNGGAHTLKAARNTPLRAGKGNVFEGGIRVPFAARWPARLTAGVHYHEPVICLDILPTAAAVAGAGLPRNVRVDGVNLVPYLIGENRTPPHIALFWRSSTWNRFAVRQGPYKLVGGEGPALMLFDLSADEGEQQDLAAAKPDIVQRLKTSYDAWNKDLIPPRWPNPGVARPAAAKK